ncbi:MAG: 5'/3'-nucleotidase SurE [Tagaea sp.]|nr:5'/3'-nucleotidase SurE [Azospirillum sp.]MCZ8124057.1 5'/3'-nucleotidase SurE [Magnetospirillum sp.]
MFGKPIDPSKARILVVNDDGYRATGIGILEKIARKLSRDVWVVAPESEQSAVSHSLTIRRPLRIRKMKGNRYAVDGTPTDSVMLAVQEIMKDKRPTLCLSGINRGANLGDDVTYSGTIAAAMEATILGVPAIALSQFYTSPHPVKWTTAQRHAEATIRKILKLGWPEETLINVNFPDVPAAAVRGIEVARQGRYKTGDEIARNVDPRGEPYFWIGQAMRGRDTRRGTDIRAVDTGHISVTPIHLDLTHKPTLRRFAKGLA